MDDHLIPAFVKEEAARNGFNSIDYAGRLDGSDYYAVALLTRMILLLTGMPTFLSR